jgi:hypothetical protein
MSARNINEAGRRIEIAVGISTGEGAVLVWLQHSNCLKEGLGKENGWQLEVKACSQSGDMSDKKAANLARQKHHGSNERKKPNGEESFEVHAL